MRRTKFSLQALCQVKTGCLVPQGLSAVLECILKKLHLTPIGNIGGLSG